MAEIGSERLFPNEADFVRWLADLIRGNANYRQVSEDAILRRSGPDHSMARADILAMRTEGDKVRLLVVECKNRPLYGAMVDQAIDQLRRYIAMSPGAVPVLAVPSRLSEEDAARVLAAKIELWDLDKIAELFRPQLSRVSEQLAVALRLFDLPKTQEELLLQELKDCTPGKPQWSIYQRLVGRMLEHLFCPPLNVPLSESPDQSGVNRRDFILANYADQGFWNHIRLRYSADYIVVDAKNYVGKIKKREVLQMANYLRSHGAGLFGIIFSRNGGDNSAWVTAREQWAHYQKLVLILEDKHCEAMLAAFASGDATSVLSKQIQDFRLAM